MSAKDVKLEARNRTLDEGEPLFGVRHHEIFRELWLREYPNADGRTRANLKFMVELAKKSAKEDESLVLDSLIQESNDGE